MPAPPQTRTSISTFTWLGLIIALFAMLIVRQALALFPAIPATICRESLHWLCAIALLVIVRRGERLPFTSIGIGTCPLSRSLGSGAVLAVVCLAVGFAIAVLTHFNGGPSGESLSKLPLWLVLLIIVRAGVVEELFYRGFAIERLQAVGLNKYLAAGIPLIVFSVGHWRGGWANIVIALALGAVFSAYYLWRRDLVANMIGHFAVDFVGVVLPRLVHHS
jgi:membrane protease YdiL (CAAX protease family)